MQGVVTGQYGQHGIIRETDMYTKRTEFQLWAMEVKKVDIENLPKQQEKELFTDFMEDYNTVTLPHRKYYDLEAYEREQALKAARKGKLHVVRLPHCCCCFLISSSWSPLCRLVWHHKLD